DVSVLGGAVEAVHRRAEAARAREAPRELAGHTRRGARTHGRRKDSRGDRPQRYGLQLLLHGRLEALLSDVVWPCAAFGPGAVSEDGRAARIAAYGERCDVRALAAGWKAQPTSRSVCRIAALSPGAGLPRLRRLPDLHRRRAL